VKYLTLTDIPLMVSPTEYHSAVFLNDFSSCSIEN